MAWKDYLVQAVSETAGEMGLAMTEAEIAEMAEGLEGWVENFGMAHGHDAIPNPMRAELHEVRQGHEREVKDWEKVVAEKDERIKRLGWEIERLRGDLADTRRAG